MPVGDLYHILLFYDPLQRSIHAILARLRSSHMDTVYGAGTQLLKLRKEWKDKKKEKRSDEA